MHAATPIFLTPVMGIELRPSCLHKSYSDQADSQAHILGFLSECLVPKRKGEETKRHQRRDLRRDPRVQPQMLARFIGSLFNPSFGLPGCTMAFRVGTPGLLAAEVWLHAWMHTAGIRSRCGNGSSSASCTLAWHRAQAGKAPSAKGNGV